MTAEDNPGVNSSRQMALSTQLMILALTLGPFTLVLFSVLQNVRLGNVDRRQIGAAASAWAVLVAFGNGAGIIRSVLAFWVVLMGFTFSFRLLERDEPEALRDVEYWSKHSRGLLYLLPAIAIMCVAVAIWSPGWVH